MIVNNEVITRPNELVFVHHYYKSSNVNIDTVSNINADIMAYDTSLSDGTLKIILLVIGGDRVDTIKRVSALISMYTSKCKIVLDEAEPGFIYDCVFQSYSTDMIDDCKYMVTLTFTANKYNRYSTVVRLKGNTEYTLNVGGTWKTNMRISAIVPNTLSSVVINGITVSNLSADVSTNVVVVDGINGVITCNGENKFLDTDITEFPMLTPGDNTITISNELIPIVIAYNERFI